MVLKWNRLTEQIQGQSNPFVCKKSNKLGKCFKILNKILWEQRNDSFWLRGPSFQRRSEHLNKAVEWVRLQLWRSKRILASVVEFTIAVCFSPRGSWQLQGYSNRVPVSTPASILEGTLSPWHNFTVRLYLSTLIVLVEGHLGWSRKSSPREKVCSVTRKEGAWMQRSKTQLATQAWFKGLLV